MDDDMEEVRIIAVVKQENEGSVRRMGCGGGDWWESYGRERERWFEILLRGRRSTDGDRLERFELEERCLDVSLAAWLGNICS